MKKFMILFIIMLIISTMGFTQKSIKVNSPNGGEEWLRGSAHSITWNSTNLTNLVKITLWKNGVFKGLIVKDQPANGIHNWTVGNYQGGIAAYGTDYKIKIREQGGAAYTTEDMSDSNFKIKSKFTLGIKPEIVKKKPVFKPGPNMFRPKITAAFDIPLGALKADSRLLLKGVNFGTKKGKILMYGDFTINPIELVNVQWVSSTKVNGYIPKSANGQKNQLVKIVVETFYGHVKSKPWTGISFKGREEKVLYQDGVTYQCGQGANWNVCNRGSDNPPQYAIAGWHKNNWGTIGDDVGDDKYFITLKNGWKFKSMRKAKWEATSTDDTISGPNPVLPVGGTVWNPVIHWKVTPNDKIFYWIEVIVDGPIGTNYK